MSDASPLFKISIHIQLSECFKTLATCFGSC